MNATRKILKGLFALIFLSAAIGNFRSKAVAASLQSLGYPNYMHTILGTAYLAGVICIYQPLSAPLKGWANGGFMVALVGAAASHIMVGQPLPRALPAVGLLTLLVGLLILESRYERHRRVNFNGGQGDS